MAEKKADGNGDEFLAWLAENAPPENIIATVEYGNGKEKNFHFKRSLEAYERYVRSISEVDAEGRSTLSPLATGSTFVLDSVAKSEREDLAKLMKAYPANVADLALALARLYSSSAKITVKNASKPAGP